MSTATSGRAREHRVVRNLASDKTHVMDVVRTYSATMFGADYERPSVGPAACGVWIGDGVVMRAGTRVRCSACRNITGVTEQTP